MYKVYSNNIAPALDECLAANQGVLISPVYASAFRSIDLAQDALLIGPSTLTLAIHLDIPGKHQIELTSAGRVLIDSAPAPAYDFLVPTTAATLKVLRTVLDKQDRAIPSVFPVVCVSDDHTVISSDDSALYLTTHSQFAQEMHQSAYDFETLTTATVVSILAALRLAQHIPAQSFLLAEGFRTDPLNPGPKGRHLRALPTTPGATPASYPSAPPPSLAVAKDPVDTAILAAVTYPQSQETPEPEIAQVSRANTKRSLLRPIKKLTGIALASALLYAGLGAVDFASPDPKSNFSEKVTAALSAKVSSRAHRMLRATDLDVKNLQCSEFGHEQDSQYCRGTLTGYKKNGKPLLVTFSGVLSTQGQLSSVLVNNKPLD